MIATAFALLLWLQGSEFVPGAVSGQLRTIDGIPAVNTRIIALRVPRGPGNPNDSLNYFELQAPAEVTLTDNEGNYRLQDLQPGRYYIMAGAAGDDRATYYPEAKNIRDATVIEVESGVLTENLSFSLLSRLGGRVSGRVNTNLAALGRRTATITGGKLEELLEVPVRPDGSFEFGHVPPGKYLLSLYPPTPGIASMPITVTDDDVSGLELVPLPTKTVAGRIVVRNGAIPHGILGFYTVRTYVGATINPDGTFSVALHAARHQIDFAGLPVGYSLASVKVDSQDMTQGIVVGNTDVSNVVITLNAPKHLAVVRGRIAGLPVDRYASTLVSLTGPTFNRLQADVQPDGTFEFPEVQPGSYNLSLSGVPDLAPISVVVDSFRTFEVNVVVPAR